MELRVEACSWPYKKPFKIASSIFDTVDFLDVTLSRDGFVGRGEGIGIPYKGETPESMIPQIENARAEIEAGATREDLATLLPHGGARNALDCAFWDFECKQTGQSIWQKLGIEPHPVQTVYTIGIDDLDKMALDAKSASTKLLKIKVDGADAIDQVRVVRNARPDVSIIVDANRSLGSLDIEKVLHEMQVLGVEMVEQPVEMGCDSDLAGIASPVPLCADESCLTSDDLDTIEPYYDLVNIKLDKTGGLTHALELADEAKKRGLKLMVGCMAGTSLSMAPAFVIGQSCVYVDIDGPLLMKSDRDPAMIYTHGEVQIPDRRLWG